MEFVVNEKGCEQLRTDMTANMKEISNLVSEITSKRGLLQAALGDDYAAIDKSVCSVVSELDSASSELGIITNDMREYLSRVHQVRVSLG